MFKPTQIEDFIKQAVQKFGNKYNYEKVKEKYIKLKSPAVDITCNACNTEFSQKPSDHLRGQLGGCKKCYVKEMTKTKEQYIQEARKIHGDYYDYSLVEYKTTHDNIIIICPIQNHGCFSTNAKNHIDINRATNCPKCSVNAMKTTEQFKEEANKIHNNMYNYDKVNYKGIFIKVEILCENGHLFMQSPNVHLRGSGCKECQDISRRLTLQEVIEKAEEIHGKLYDYSLIEYKSLNEKVKILCKIHGIFEQTLLSHIYNQSDCQLCIGNILKTREQFIEESISIHSDKYDYSNVDYKGKDIKVKILCKIHNFIFEQTPHNHRHGAGCPRCMYKNETLCVEFLEKITNHPFIKIRPKFLNGLELDAYNQDLKLALEYQGQQHYHIVDFFNKNEQGLKDQQDRDLLKKKLCNKERIYLIIVPYFIKDKQTFIQNEYDNYVFLNSFG